MEKFYLKAAVEEVVHSDWREVKNSLSAGPERFIIELIHLLLFPFTYTCLKKSAQSHKGNIKACAAQVPSELKTSSP